MAVQSTQAEGLQAGRQGNLGMCITESAGPACDHALEHAAHKLLGAGSPEATAPPPSIRHVARAKEGVHLGAQAAAAVLGAALASARWAILLLASVMDTRPSETNGACGLAPAATVVLAASQDRGLSARLTRRSVPASALLCIAESSAIVKAAERRYLDGRGSMQCGSTPQGQQEPRRLKNNTKMQTAACSTRRAPHPQALAGRHHAGS